MGGDGRDNESGREKDRSEPGAGAQLRTKDASVEPASRRRPLEVSASPDPSPPSEGPPRFQEANFACCSKRQISKWDDNAKEVKLKG